MLPTLVVRTISCHQWGQAGSAEAKRKRKKERKNKGQAFVHVTSQGGWARERLFPSLVAGQRVPVVDNILVTAQKIKGHGAFPALSHIRCDFPTEAEYIKLYMGSALSNTPGALLHPRSS